MCRKIYIIPSLLRFPYGFKILLDDRPCGEDLIGSQSSDMFLGDQITPTGVGYPHVAGLVPYHQSWTEELPSRALRLWALPFG